jgi:hypothetical protein
MVDMRNNHNLFSLPYWAPALWRVPIPLQLLNEAYAQGPRVRERSDAEQRLAIESKATSISVQRGIGGLVSRPFPSAGL